MDDAAAGCNPIPAFAGGHGVPVILAAGDSAAAAELETLLKTETVTTKTAESPASARLVHPERVHERLREGVRRALARLDAGGYSIFDLGTPVRIRMRFASTTHVDILQSIPGMSKVDGFTVAYTANGGDTGARYVIWQVVDQITLTRIGDGKVISKKEVRSYTQQVKYPFE